MNPRRGATLIEMVLCISLGSSLALCGVSMVHKMIQVRQAAQEECRRVQVVGRFLTQIRSDVGSAFQVEQNNPKQLKIQGGSGHVIEYSSDGTLVRRESQVEGKRSFDQIHLGLGYQLEFEILDDNRQVVTALYFTPELKHAQPRLQRRVFATTGVLPESAEPTTVTKEPVE